jgi:hypothetical protein
MKAVYALPWKNGKICRRKNYSLSPFGAGETSSFMRNIVRMGHRSHLSSFAGQCTAAKRANERKRFATIGISPDLDWAQRVESVRPTESYLRGSICDPVSRIASLKICLLLYSRFSNCSIELLLIESQRINLSMPSYVFTGQDYKLL